MFSPVGGSVAVLLTLGWSLSSSSKNSVVPPVSLATPCRSLLQARGPRPRPKHLQRWYTVYAYNFNHISTACSMFFSQSLFGQIKYQQKSDLTTCISNLHASLTLGNFWCHQADRTVICALRGITGHFTNLGFEMSRRQNTWKHRETLSAASASLSGWLDTVLHE